MRVGGGFMQIDDFIEQYETQEVEKRENKPVNQTISNMNLETSISRNSINQSVLSHKNKLKI